MNNENRNDEAVSPVIATILMVAITVVLAGVLYVWASSLAGDSTGGTLETYTWSDKDAAGSMSDGAGDALIEVGMTGGAALNWAVVSVTISVDGGTPQTCAEDDSTAACSYTSYGDAGNDKAWETGEGITISEGASDLCDGSNGGCSVEVTLVKSGVGNEDDKTIGTVNGYADANA
ncbi:MAG: type IV pilin [Candidatus Poseidoniaceae archaeon]|nr:type IV pilin [Candidatus Poseidoniaceae archaeon]